MKHARASFAPPSALHPDEGQTRSAWLCDSSAIFRPLDGGLSADVCVVGAGIAGVSAAYLLAREGRTVVVVDDGPLGGGETCRTTAHLSTLLDRRYVQLERMHGAKRTRLIAESHAQAIALIEAITHAEDVDCDFERLDGYLFAAPGQDPATLEEEHAAVFRAGVSDVTWVERAPLADFESGRCLRFPAQAQCHPLRYLVGLADAVLARGGAFRSAHVTRVATDAGETRVETTSGQMIHAAAVIIATNTPVNDLVTIHTKQEAYRSYVIAARLPVRSVPHALYWDTAEPYHYARLQPYDATHDLLIVGGEDHRTGGDGEAKARWERLDLWARARFGTLGRIEYRWSAQVLETIDGIAFIGPNPGDAPNVFVATGDCGNGMTHGTIAGRLLADLILDRPNPWAALYDPSRVTLGALGSYAKIGVHTAVGYAGWLVPAERAAVDRLAPGQGMVVRRGLHRVAVYRDAAGVLHERSAVCPHLGGPLTWNAGEQSWDCPCHGSRFSATGVVLNGPANSDLAPSS